MGFFLTATENLDLLSLRCHRKHSPPRARGVRGSAAGSGAGGPAGPGSDLALHQTPGRAPDSRGHPSARTLRVPRERIQRHQGTPRRAAPLSRTRYRGPPTADPGAAPLGPEAPADSPGQSCGAGSRRCHPQPRGQLSLPATHLERKTKQGKPNTE